MVGQGESAMKHVWKGAVVIGAVALMVGALQAEPIHWEFTPDSAKILTQSTGTGVIASQSFRVPYAPPYTFAVFASDTGAGSGATVCSVSVTLQKSVDYAEDGASVTAASNWLDIAEIVMKAGGASMNVAEIRPLCTDSVESGAYDIGGQMRFLFHSGTTGGGDGANASDTLAIDLTYDVYLEAVGQD